jgi:N-acetyl-gamma-glutamyl-phosphate reductase
MTELGSGSSTGPSRATPLRAGIIGASGYTGGELARLLAGHPDIQLVGAAAASRAGLRLADVYPQLAAAYPDLVLTDAASADLDGLDVVFLCLGHGLAQDLVPELIDRVGHIVDLSADFRLRQPALYETWYGAAHRCPELLDRFAFAVPELDREVLRGARLVAAPGCYVTAAALALTPLVRGKVVSPTGIVVDGASGVSGAGAAATAATHYVTVNDDFRAYGVLTHRHTPEMEQVIGAEVLFTAHLAPMTRGILVTCYAREAPGDHPDPAEVLAEFYAKEQFVSVQANPPSTREVQGTNRAAVAAWRDRRTGWVVSMAAIDNLVKGASGQAVQCANLALGLEEGAGLTQLSLVP